MSFLSCIISSFFFHKIAPLYFVLHHYTLFLYSIDSCQLCLWVPRFTFFLLKLFYLIYTDLSDNCMRTHSWHSHKKEKGVLDKTPSRTWTMKISDLSRIGHCLVQQNTLHCQEPVINPYNERYLQESMKCLNNDCNNRWSASKTKDAALARMASNKRRACKIDEVPQNWKRCACVNEWNASKTENAARA